MRLDLCDDFRQSLWNVDLERRIRGGHGRRVGAELGSHDVRALSQRGCLVQGDRPRHALAPEAAAGREDEVLGPDLLGWSGRAGARDREVLAESGRGRHGRFAGDGAPMVASLARWWPPDECVARSLEQAAPLAAAVAAERQERICACRRKMSWGSLPGLGCAGFAHSTVWKLSSGPGSRAASMSATSELIHVTGVVREWTHRFLVSW